MRTRTIPQVGLYAASECEAACGFPGRSLEFLRREGLLPVPYQKGGRGTAELFDFTGFSVLAVTGVLYKATGLLASSSRIALAIVEEIDSIYGKIQINLEGHLPELSTIARKDIAWTDRDTFDSYSLYVAIRKSIIGYEPGFALRDDFIIVIADGRFVYSKHHEGKIRFFDPAVRMVAGVEKDLQESLKFIQPELEIEPIERGKAVDAHVTPFHMMGNDPESLAQARHRFDRAYLQACSLVHVNFSLAIRNALEALFQARLKFEEAQR